MSDWIDVGPLAEIPRQGARTIESPRGRIAVFRTVEDDVFAVLDRCPHKGGPLSQGIVHDRKVTCPLHGWTIDLAAGEAVAPDHGCVKRFPVRLEAERVLLQLSEV